MTRVNIHIAPGPLLPFFAIIEAILHTECEVGSHLSAPAKVVLLD
jgi:hypothetical protein